jgi:nucleoside-diphosphate-sugar epimerase
VENSGQGSSVKLIGAIELQKITRKLSFYPKICITGASGWLGKETADLLSRALGDDFERRVTLVSSNGRQIELLSGEHNTISWRDFVYGSGYDLIIHFAFLSPENIVRLGVDAYIEVNREIISDLLIVASKNPSGSILTASSGATSCYRSDLKSKVPYEIYSGIKNEMENVITQSELFKYVGIMRIWNISGVYLDVDSAYALSSFIRQGLNGDVIEIRGAPESLRTYVNAQEMMWVYLMSLGMVNRIPLNSGGFSTTLLQLAGFVSNYMRNKEVLVSGAPEVKTASIYSPDPEKFNSLASLYLMKLSDVEEQVNLVLRSFGK